MSTRFSIALAGLALTAAACANYKGEGNSFDIEGPVIGVGDHSISIYPQRIVGAEGKAHGWFAPKDKTQVHDNYRDSWCDIKRVGDVFALDGQSESTKDVKPGDWVELQGLYPRLQE
jgi:hypothetical protein